MSKIVTAQFDAKQVHKTPRGIAVYPKLIEPETKFNSAGLYSVRMKFEPADEATLVEKLTALYEVAYAQNCKKEFKTQLKKADVPWKRDANSASLLFNFKMTASGVDSAGKPWSRKPQIFDAKCNEVTSTADLRIGSGTEMLVMFRALPFYNAMVGSGISLRLEGVRIFKLVDWKRDAKFFGFEAEEGWNSQAASAGSTPVRADEEFSSGPTPEEAPMEDYLA